MNKAMLIGGVVVLGWVAVSMVAKKINNRKVKKLIIEDGGVVEIDPIYGYIYESKKD